MNSFELLDTPLSNEMDAALQDTLRQGEAVAWAGPRLASSTMRQSVPAFIFGVIFTAIAVFIIYSIYANATNAGKPVPTLPMLFVLPFVLVGLLFMASPMMIAKSASRTFYAVTNQRALVVYLKKNGQTVVYEYTPERLGNITVREKDAGSGDIIFQIIHTRMQGSGEWPEQRIFKGFLGIANVREVEAHVKSLVASAPSHRS